MRPAAPFHLDLLAIIALGALALFGALCTWSQAFGRFAALALETAWLYVSNARG